MELEELSEIDEGLETIERKTLAFRFQYPVVTVTEKVLLFNGDFTRYLGDVRYITFRISTNYVVIRPSKVKSSSSFSIYKAGDFNGRVCTIPVAMKEKKIQKGTYKLYKFKDGWAFKRYEPIGGTER